MALESSFIDININGGCTFQLFEEIKLERDYSVIFPFNSVEEKEEFFAPKIFKTAENVKYVRETRAFRIEANITEILNVNYCRFNNKRYKDFWYYAFVVNIVYVNPNVTDIFFEVDCFTTFQEFLDIKDCLITQQHESTTIYSNTFPENLGVGEYILNSVKYIDLQNSGYYYLIISNIDLTQSPGTYENPKIYAATGGVYCGVPSAASAYILKIDGEGAADNRLQDLLQSLSQFPWVAQSIQGIYVYPKYFFPQDAKPVTTFTGVTLWDATGTQPINVYYNVGNTIEENFPNYIWNKLYNFPYSFIKIRMPDGQTLDLKPELFKKDILQFRLMFSMIPSPQFIITPLWYGENYQVDTDKSDVLSYSLTYSNFLTVPILNNIYPMVMAQNQQNFNLNYKQSKENLLLDSLTSVGNIIASAFTGNISGIVTNTVEPLRNIRSWEYETQRQLDKLNQYQTSIGTINNVAPGNATIMFANDQFRIAVEFYCMKEEYIRMANNYFTMFGYSNFKLAPISLNFSGRYKYIKCSYVNIFGDIPDSYLQIIRNIFLNGTTMWKDREHVGEY